MVEYTRFIKRRFNRKSLRKRRLGAARIMSGGVSSAELSILRSRPTPRSVSSLPNGSSTPSRIQNPDIPSWRSIGCSNRPLLEPGSAIHDGCSLSFETMTDCSPIAFLRRIQMTKRISSQSRFRKCEAGVDLEIADPSAAQLGKSRCWRSSIHPVLVMAMWSSRRTVPRSTATDWCDRDAAVQTNKGVN